MDFRIADTFTDSLSRLTGDEQKAAKTTTFDLQLNPAQPGLSFHTLDKARDRNFWSVRVSSDIRWLADVRHTRTVLKTRRGAASAHMAESVAALESIRLDLLRLHAGAGDRAPLTTLIDAARLLGEDVNRPLPDWGGERSFGGY